MKNGFLEDVYADASTHWPDVREANQISAVGSFGGYYDGNKRSQYGGIKVKEMRFLASGAALKKTYHRECMLLGRWLLADSVSVHVFE